MVSCCIPWYWLRFGLPLFIEWQGYDWWSWGWGDKITSVCCDGPSHHWLSVLDVWHVQTPCLWGRDRLVQLLPSLSLTNVVKYDTCSIMKPVVVLVFLYVLSLQGHSVISYSEVPVSVVTCLGSIRAGQSHTLLHPLGGVNRHVYCSTEIRCCWNHIIHSCSREFLGLLGNQRGGRGMVLSVFLAHATTCDT